MTRDGDRPLAQGTLASETADFSRYASGFSMRGPNGRDWNQEPLDVKALDGFDLDLRLSAGRILFNKTELERVAMAAAVRSGRFTLSVGEAQIFGGMLHATAAIGPAATGTEIKVEANVKDFDAERGLGELAGIRRLEGAGSLALTARVRKTSMERWQYPQLRGQAGRTFRTDRSTASMSSRCCGGSNESRFRRPPTCAAGARRSTASSPSFG